MGALCRLVIFDCDGTLVDSQHSIVASMQAAWSRLGLEEPTAADVRRVVGLSLKDAARTLLPEGDEALWDSAVGYYREAFARLREEQRSADPLFPGVREGLSALGERGLLLGVATGKSRRGLERTLEEHGLSELFVTLQTADDAPSKPHPGMILRAMDRTGSEPAETVMVGDTSYDVEAAVGAGATAIGVSWGYHPPSMLREAGASRVIDEFRELLDLVPAG